MNEHHASGPVIASRDEAAGEALGPLRTIEELLADDPNGFALKAVKEDLFDIDMRVRRRLRAGLDPADHRRHEALSAALAHAAEVVDEVWERQNRTPG